MTDFTITTGKHTPGPWELNDLGLVYGQAGPDEEEAPFVCDVANDGVGLMTDEEWANGYMIEAAPDLLAALERAVAAQPSFIMRYSDGTADLTPEWVQQARAAIAKAQGGAA